MSDIPTSLQIADSLVRQQRLNDAIIDALVTARDTLEAVSAENDDTAESLGQLSAELALTNQRIESLTATVGRLMLAIEPTEPDLHSVKA